MKRSYGSDYLKKELGDVFASQGVRLAYYFGSHVGGVTGEMSDIDIAVLWPDEQKKPLTASLTLQHEVRERLSDDRIEIGPLNNQALSFCYNVIKTGICIWGTEKDRVWYETYILDEYLDFLYLAEEYNRSFSIKSVRR